MQQTASLQQKMAHQYFAPILFIQAVIVCVLAAVLYFLGHYALAAAVYCGAISSWLPTAVSIWMTATDEVESPVRSVATIYGGEIFKILFSVAMLWLAFAHYVMPILPLLASYLAMTLSTSVLPMFITCYKALTNADDLTSAST